MKSHVTMEQNVCIVCGKEFDTGNLLIDKQLRQRFESKTVTEFGMCPKHQKLKDKGFIALIGIDPKKSEELMNGNIKPESAYRTGKVAHLKEEVFNKIFNCGHNNGIVFCDDELIEKLKEMTQND